MVLIKMILRPWTQSFWTQLFGCVAVGILLLLSGVLFWMERGLKPVLHRLQTEQVYTFYIDPEISADSEMENRLLSSANELIEPLGLAVTLTRSSEFIENLKSTSPELANQLANMGAEANTLVPRYLTVTGSLDEENISKMRKIQGIVDHESSQGRFNQVLGAFETIRWVSKVLGLGVLAAALMGLVLLARANREIQANLVALLTSWGAMPLVSWMPLLFTATLVGAIGGGIAALEWYSVGRLVVDKFRSLYPVLQAMPEFSKSMSIALFGLGAALGLFASVLGMISKTRTAVR